MDEIDGGTEVQRVGCSMACATVLQALAAGMNTQNWNIIAEAYIMVQQIEFRYRAGDQKTSGIYSPPVK